MLELGIATTQLFTIEPMGCILLILVLLEEGQNGESLKNIFSYYAEVIWIQSPCKML